MLVLHCAFHGFDEQLAQHVGSFKYEKTSIKFQRANNQTWGAVETKRLQAAELKTANSGHFAVIAAARAWLHHNAQRSIDAKAVLVSMGRTLHALSGLQHGQPAPPGNGPPAGWQHWEQLWTQLSHAGRVSVVLRVTARHMRIPIAQDRVFVGREQDVEAVTRALVELDAQPIRGARVRLPLQRGLCCVVLHLACCAQAALGVQREEGECVVAPPSLPLEPHARSRACRCW